MELRSGQTLVFDKDEAGNRRVILVPDTLIDAVQPTEPSRIVERARALVAKYPEQVTVMDAITLEEISRSVDYVMLLFHGAWMGASAMGTTTLPAARGKAVVRKKGPPVKKGKKGSAKAKARGGGAAGRARGKAGAGKRGGKGGGKRGR